MWRKRVRPEDDGGWGDGPDAFPATNILRIYRPGNVPEENFATRTKNGHEKRLFIHSLCTGNRASYTAQHVNQLLTASDNPEGIKERIAQLIPHLSADQLGWLASDINTEALHTLTAISPETAEKLRRIKTQPSPGPAL